MPCHMVQDRRWNEGTFASLHDLLLACCDRLKATHGYAGFALALPHEYYRLEPYNWTLRSNTVAWKSTIRSMSR